MFRASNLFSNDEKLRAQAAGSFVSNTTTPPTFNRPDSHPVMKMIRGSSDIRNHQRVTSSKTDGILAIYQNRVITLNVPQIGYDHLDDENESNPLITGALGLEVAKTYPTFAQFKETTSDLFSLGRQEDTTFFRELGYPRPVSKMPRTPLLTL